MPGLVFRVAKLLQVAAVTFGFACDADLAAVMDQLMAEGDPSILGDDCYQLLFNLLRRVAFGQ